MRMRHMRGRIGLSIIFAAVVFMIMLVAAAMMAVIGYLAIRTGAFEYLSRGRAFFPLLLLLIISLTVGTVVSYVISCFLLKPVRKVIEAVNKLANGDFSTRLGLSGPPEIKELSDSFNRMADELGGTELLRTDFINNFSHEFKTPIVSIKGFAEELKNDDLTPAQRNEYLDIIIAESARLASLSTNVLNLSKVESQMILTDKRDYNLTEQIRRSILMFESQWERNDIDLAIDLDEVCFKGNEELMSQIWMNLIDNAIKFTPKGGQIAIGLRREAGKVLFSICDSGFGINREALEHIFDKFYQADRSHATMGNGLGLTVARQIARLHGGDITCKSVEDQGTEFTVILPAGVS